MALKVHVRDHDHPDEGLQFIGHQHQLQCQIFAAQKQVRELGPNHSSDDVQAPNSEQDRGEEDGQQVQEQMVVPVLLELIRLI